jgi:hypothetical protein
MASTGTAPTPVSTASTKRFRFAPIFLFAFSICALLGTTAIKLVDDLTKNNNMAYPTINGIPDTHHSPLAFPGHHSSSLPDQTGTSSAITGTRIGITIAVLSACLFIILAKRYAPKDKHWAYATAGTIVGYWLKG